MKGAALAACLLLGAVQLVSAQEPKSLVSDLMAKGKSAFNDLKYKQADSLGRRALSYAALLSTQQKVEARRGMKFVYTAAIDIAEFNYGPYVEQLKSHGVRWVQFIGQRQKLRTMCDCGHVLIEWGVIVFGVELVRCCAEE